MKRILSVLTAIILLISAIPISLSVSAASEGDLSFSLILEDESYSVSSCNLSASGELIIPATYNNKPVTTIGPSAFNGCTKITSITIPESITSIGIYAFNNCTSLTTVNFNAIECTTIGQSNYPAFSGCSNLTTINIGEKVTTLPKFSFVNCTSITTVNFNAVNCTTLGSESYPVFSDCSNLTTINIGDKVTTIPTCAFRGCVGLTSINISDSVLSIGSRAFYGCSNLVSITISDSVTSIGYCAFERCTNLQKVYYNGDISDWCNITFDSLYSNPLYCNDKSSQLYINGELISGAIVLPDSVSQIPMYAFAKQQITSITIPNSVTSIDQYAFLGCSSLSSIEIPNSVTYIGESAFSNCDSLISIALPDSVTYISSSLFSGCNGLTSITIPRNVTFIGASAFNHCDSLTSIAIPDSVTSVRKNAFADCEKLTHVWYEGDELAKNELSIGTGNNNLQIASWRYNCIIENGHVYDTTCDRICNICEYERSITHAYQPTYDNVNHYDECTVCFDKVNVQPHNFDNACDTNCPCGYIREITHDYKATFDTENHFDKCSACDDVINVKSHAFDNACDTTCDCGYVRAITHNHQPSFDGDNHFEKCTVCGDVINVKAHEFVNACDTDCACGYERTITHNYQDTYNAAGHFEECTVCGNIGFGEPHTFDNDCDTACDCGYERTITHSYGKYVYNNDATAKKDGTKTRTCKICGDTQTITATGTKWTNPFTDVKKSDFYYEPVLWAVNNGITAGATKTTFEPNSACTRGQIATFLWRAAGQPTPSTSKNPFTDVKKSDYYYKAVLWAVGAGITSGTSTTTFSPNDPCTRGQIATFLWRANGGKKVNASNPFTDVKKSDYYYNAVLWAVKNNITAGTSKTTFEPNAPCTRGQIATFLYRAYN